MKPSVSLFMIDTSAPTLARAAVNMSVSKFNFDRVLVFTNTPENYSGYQCVQIPVMTSSEAYSNLVLQQVPEFLETDFVLIAHYDGFILNGDQFSPHFYHYDYIGAPWPMWKVHNVGNGGFTWRSRKLCHAARRLTEGRQILDAEDLYICRLHRIALEAKFGCRFADEGLASHFSFEMEVPPYPTFGFHGAHHLPALYREQLDFLFEGLPDRIFVHGEGVGKNIRQAVGMISPEALARFESIASERADIATARRRG
jgi:hypothetical protein